jgi:hypothetical protein
LIKTEFVLSEGKRLFFILQQLFCTEGAGIVSCAVVTALQQRQNPCSDLFNAHVWIRPDRLSDYMVHSIGTWLFFFPAR